LPKSTINSQKKHENNLENAQSIENFEKLPQVFDYKAEMDLLYSPFDLTQNLQDKLTSLKRIY
jgi:hypothetical protein